MLGICYHITGIVQGVGFRPFVYRAAITSGVTGDVCNSDDGVWIHAFGTESQIASFEAIIRTEPPPMARVDGLTSQTIPWTKQTGFTVIESIDQMEHFVPVSPDIAICSECRAEILNPNERRFHYAFTNCTNCGPRFSIIDRIPYDRQNTSMVSFKMCADCQSEYDNPADRRFHAQPIACPKCGPKLRLIGADDDGSNPLLQTVELLRAGKIAAIKGIGGFHLACDAGNAAAVEELRRRKHRSARAFALMARDVETIRKYAYCDETEAELLSGPSAPIVLLQKRTDALSLPEEIAPKQYAFGFMLPYTPLHVLLFDLLGQDAAPLVMTSANLSEEPIVYSDDEQDRLTGLSDFILTHDRPIRMRIDDSVARVLPIERNQKKVVSVIRRARGFAPDPVLMKTEMESILAVGGELKNTFCLTRGHYAFVSHYIGDMENYETVQSFEDCVTHYEKLFRVIPRVIACDMHPNYFSTKYAFQTAQKGNLRLIPVQHHFAHIASVIAENELSAEEPVIGLAFDGTGYGMDGTIWGGETLICSLSGFKRRFHLESFQLPGGDSAVRRPSKIALSLLYEYGIPWEPDNPAVKSLNIMERKQLVKQLSAGINCVQTTSMGRLFDAVSSLAGICHSISYEGQAAIEFESLALNETTVEAYPFELYDDCVTLEPMIETLLEDVRNGIAGSVISAKFHNGIAALCLKMCDTIRTEANLSKVVLSGGVWQNQRLTCSTVNLLQKAGFEVLLPVRLPFNDGCISFGQAVVVNEIIRKQI